jgi:tetratricopeptide (TPR) repeat protein/O-antigen ligase
MGEGRLNWRYLAHETALILGLSYVLWLGGTYHGLIFLVFRRISFVVLMSAGALWLIWRWRCRGGPSPLRASLLVLLLVYCAAATGSSDPRRSLIIVWQIGLAIWIFWLTVDLLRAGWPAELWVKGLLAAGSVVLAHGCVSIVRWYGDWLEIGGLTQLVPPIILRLWTLPGHPNFVAGALNLLWPLALARAMGGRSRLAWGVLGAWVAGAWLVIFFTSSRGGWLGTAAALAVLLTLWVLDRGGVGWLRSGWVWVRRRRAVQWAGGLALVIGLAGVAMVAWKQLNHPSHGSLLMARREFWPPAWEAFLREPLLGIGPFTFAGEFNRANSVPPTGIFTHAHSICFNVLAEAGVTGLGALLWVAAAAGWGLVRTWRATEPGKRAELMGAAAALTSAAVHGFFDTVQMMPTLAMLLAMAGAIGLHRPGAPPRGRGWAAPILWLLLVGTAAWSLWGYGPAAEGVAAGNMGDWEAAVPLLETAVERDPALAINEFHAGYAHGVLAAENPAHLEPAIAHYRAGIAHDPSYAPLHANLASLLWAAGEQEEAIAEMEAAVELAPRAAVFHLNLGDYHAETGATDRALAAYSEAIELGHWEAAQFWESTPVRALALAHVREDSTAELEEGWAALEQGQPAAARSQFEALLSRQPNSVAAYRGLAALALAEGDREAARRNLQVALFIGSTYSPEEHLRAQMDWARLAAGEGELEQAISRAQPVLDAFRRQTFWGVGRYGTADYGWYVYYRESLLSDMLPQVATVRMPDEAAQWTLEVAAWQRQIGRTGQALALCQEVLEALPDSVGARECVDGLAD